MGCHTWFYTKSNNQYDYDTIQKRVIEMYQDTIDLMTRYTNDNLTDDEIELGIFNSYTKESIATQILVIKRKLRLVSNGYCKLATMSAFSNSCKEHFIRQTGLFYVETEYHDVFRASAYPTDVLVNVKETLNFINTHETYHYNDNYLDSINDFWKKYPEGVIIFG